eukprot:3938744-Rhodomonas_salina.1
MAQLLQTDMSQRFRPAAEFQGVFYCKSLQSMFATALCCPCLRPNESIPPCMVHGSFKTGERWYESTAHMGGRFAPR